MAFAAAAQIATTWGEESAGRVDNLLVQPMSRRRWLAGRLAGAAGMVTVASVITGIATWVGAATQNSGVGLGQLVAAGLNIAPPALFVLGAGALVYGLRPRMAPAFTFGLVAWSLLVEFAAAVIKANQWLLDTSVLTHMTPAPAADPNWSAAATLVLLGLLAAGAGVALIRPSRPGCRLAPRSGLKPAGRPGARHDLTFGTERRDFRPCRSAAVRPKLLEEVIVHDLAQHI